MRRYRWLLPLLSLALAVTPAPAQGVVIYNPYVSGSSFNYTRVGRNSVFSFSAGNYGPIGYGSGYFGPGYGIGPGYGYPYGRSTTVNIIQYSPPPVIIIPRPALLGGPEDELARAILPRREVLADRERDRDFEPLERPLPGRDAGAFRPLEPDNRNRAEKPVAPDPPPMKPPALPNAVEEMPPLPRPPMPEANPIAENARLFKLGKDAFAAQEYGRAAERFRQATNAIPADAMSHFLLAQSNLALGKYHEAADAIHAGMALQPDWPTQRFQPLELYGQNVATYPEHLRRLEDTLGKHPNDALLLFLFAYQLWFDGRKDEARPLFLRARAGADAAVIDRFLKAKPEAPPIAAADAGRNWL